MASSRWPEAWPSFYTGRVLPPTCDRGDILHLAGRRQLSPAVREDGPALVAAGEREGRCGWEAFFAELDRRGLSVREDADGSVHIGPRPRSG